MRIGLVFYMTGGTADAHWAGVFEIHGGGFCAFHSREFIRRGSVFDVGFVGDIHPPNPHPRPKVGRANAPFAGYFI